MSEFVLARIEALQQELELLKQIVAHDMHKTRQKTQLKGMWKGIMIDDADFQSARRAVFRDVDSEQKKQ